LPAELLALDKFPDAIHKPICLSERTTITTRLMHGLYSAIRVIPSNPEIAAPQRIIPTNTQRAPIPAV
jgi:hypothetical protein